MIRRINFRSFISLLIITIFLQACHDPSKGDHSRSDHEKKVVISLETFKSASGNWGYEILADGKVYIHQEFIPSLEGEQPFLSKKEAQKVGRAVLKKMTSQNTPTLSREEVLDILRRDNN
ncbi:MAG TPA: DUF4907 domain-containing protein [Prolixibacteraceae bacterium]|nr:DUF4907 domain-containing protein [Prolixibacteraceae bacterium]HPT30945.1 DUF4907 domain-containing protein [Prolixibacteraceae bacterium]